MPDDLILQTKLQPPQIKGKILHRERLLNLLKDNLDKKLILICADAGYGKTTMLTALVNHVRKPYIWYTLSSEDRYFAEFIRHLIAGIRKYRPDFGEGILVRLAKQGRVTVKHDVVVMLANELQSISHIDFWVILEDYHTISDSEEINDCLNFLLSRSSANLHIIISTRSKPSLSMQRLRSKGDCFNLSDNDLRFTYEETVTFFKDVWKLNYDNEMISSLWSKTDGWITALYLYMTFLREKKKIDLEVVQPELCEDLYKYLAEEVLLNQPTGIKDFLLKTSLLNTLQARTCNELLMIRNSLQILHRLEDSGLFTRCIDSEQGIYQYHPLFREFLTANLERTFSQEQVSELHYAAARILEKNGNHIGALEHLIAIQRWADAAKILYITVSDSEQRPQMLQIDKLVHRFPVDYVEKDVRLLLVKGLVAYYQERYKDALLFLSHAANKLKDKNRTAELKRVLTIAANAHVRLGNSQAALSLSDSVLRFHPNAKERADLLCFARGLSLLRLGRTEEALNSFTTALGIYNKIGDLKGKAGAMIHLGAAHYDTGNLTEAKQYCETARIIFEELHDNFNLGITLVNLATIYNILREDSKATEVIDQALYIGTKYDIKEVLGEMMSALGTLKINKSDSDGLSSFEQALQIFDEIGDTYDTARTILSYSDAKRLREDFSTALQLANKAGDLIRTHKIDTVKPIYLISKGIVECELGYYAKAEDNINKALKEFVKQQNKYYVFLSRLYLAYIYYLTKKNRLLLTNLRKTIASAKANSYEMTFVTEQRISAPLLSLYLAHQPGDRYVFSILAKMGKPATKYLLPLIDENNINLSRAVIELLMQIGDSAIVAKLKQCIKHKELEDVASFALKCISETGVKGLNVGFFGKMTVCRNKEMIIEWKYKAVRNLFQYLVTNKNRHLHRDVIIETFWPGVSIDKGLANLYNAISTLRKILEPGIYSKTSIIRLENEYCWLEWRSDYQYDVDDFLGYYRAGKIKEKDDRSGCFKSFERAQQIYSGDFLGEERYLDWVEQERKRLRDIFMEILAKCATFHIERKDYANAINFHHRILELDPCIEESHRELMLCYWKLNDKKKAIEQYRSCEALLNKQLGFKPSSETTRLFEIILSPA